MTDEDDPGGSTELALDFVAINDSLRADGDRAEALDRLVRLAVSSVPGCEWAAITSWPQDQPPRSLAVSGDIARATDQRQYDLGEGPCLSSAEDSEVNSSPDLTREVRWPVFTKVTLAESAVRGVLSFHLVDQPVRIALNLYSSRPGSLAGDSLTVGALFAAHARVLLMHADSSSAAAHLAAALRTSRQIGTAVGILMSVHKVTADHAFELLRASSQQLHRKLHDIAEEVADTGTLP